MKEKKSEVVVSEAMYRFSEKLKKLKPSIEELDPEERDQKVLELRNKLLSEDEIRRFVSPGPREPPEEYNEIIKLQETYLKRQREMESHLKRLSYDERCSELESLKKLVMKE